MKKILLLSALALTIVTSMVAGTLATYTKTLAPIEDTVTAKVFDISADADSENVSIDIAPTETKSWKFEVRNYENKSLPTEVDMDLGVEIIIPKFFVDNGIETTLKIENSEVTLSTVGTVDQSTGNVHYVYHGDKQFKASSASEVSGEILFYWNDDTFKTLNGGNQMTTTTAIENFGEANNFSVTVTGTQSSNN